MIQTANFTSEISMHNSCFERVYNGNGKGQMKQIIDLSTELHQYN